MTYLVDTSSWANYFREPDAPSSERLDQLMAADPRQVLGCPPVRMELSLDPDDLRRRRLLRIYDNLLSADITADDFELAADLYRATRQRGHTIRSNMDCVIAAIALRAEATLVHNDVDFDRMGEVIGELAVLRLADG